MMKVVGILLGLVVIGCASEPPPFNCPPLPTITVIEQQSLADELPKDGLTTQAIVEDYFKLRQDCSAPPPSH